MSHAGERAALGLDTGTKFARQLLAEGYDAIHVPEAGYSSSAKAYVDYWVGIDSRNMRWVR